MTELIPTIDNIIKFGLQPNLVIKDRDKLLEINLVKIYSLYFDINYDYDDNDYLEFDISGYPNIRQHIESNFKDFGLYKCIIDFENITDLKENSIGDAIDDLADIITDLIEIKWRIENNSLADGLWYFSLIFGHILNNIFLIYSTI
jgi:hypothetical protein